MFSKSLNFQPHRLLLAVLGVSFIAFSGCSSPVDVTLSCANLQVGETCSAQTNGGHIFWKTGELKSNEEYALIVMSDVEPEKLSDLYHNFTLQSTDLSAPLPSKEASDIKAVRAQQGGPGASGYGYMDESIGGPSGNLNYFTQNITDVYVPNPADYVTQKDGLYIPVYVQPPSGERLKGKKSTFQLFSSTSPFFEIIYDPALSNSAYQGLFQTSMNQFQTCLSQVIPKTIDLLGHPLDTDGQSEIKIAVTNFSGVLGANTLGLFSTVDRFEKMNGQPLQDSNHSEILFVAPPSNASVSCSTAGAHELQHLISFDRKVLSKIPANKRNDMSEINRRGLKPEFLGLNEGYSHLIEELSGETQEVGKHVYSFWTHPNLVSFDLHTSYSNNAGNTRSRGLNTLLLYYVLARAGGQLFLNDINTRQALTTLIGSPDIGYENISKYLGLTRAKLFEGFFGHMMLSLFNFSNAQTFIPAAQQGPNFQGSTVTRGLYIMDRARPLTEIPYHWPYVHPYQFDLPTLSTSEFLNFPAGGVIFRRFNVPSTLTANSQVDLGAGGKKFSAYVVRIR